MGTNVSPSFPGGKRRRGNVSPAAMTGKPLETMGRQSYGAKAVRTAMLAGLQLSKPRETVGRKANFRGLKRGPPRHASPAAGYFASGIAKKGKTIMKQVLRTAAKRALSLFLVLVMCLSLLQITAFAADPGDDDYVYVYINVTTDRDPESEPPEFEASNKEALEEAGKKVGEAKDALGAKIDEIEAAAEKLAGDMQGIENAMDKATGAEDKAENSLAELEDLKPEYGKESGPDTQTENGTVSQNESSGSQDDISGGTQTENVPQNEDGNKDGTDTQGEPKTANDGPECFDDKVKKVNEQIKALEERAKEITDRVNAANDKVDELNADARVGEEADPSGNAAQAQNACDAANAANDEIKNANTALEQALEGRRETIQAMKTAAEEAVKTANQAVTACSEKQRQLNRELAEKVSALSKPSETPPVREDGQDDAAYRAAYDAWTAECDAYNTEAAELQADYSAKAGELKALSDEAAQAAAAANSALAAAQDELNKFNQQVENAKAGAAGEAETVSDYNDNVPKYNEAAGDYNAKAEAYNGDAQAFNDTVGNYNSSVGEYSAEYNEVVTAYNDAVDKAEKAVDTYNGQVDEYNGEAADWNINKISSEVWAQVEALEQMQADIKVYQTVSDQIKSSAAAEAEEDAQPKNPLAGLSDDEIDAYNRVVSAYNEAVDRHNKKHVQETMTSLINDVKKSFPDQSPNTTDAGGGTKNTWYTIGKIYVGDIFAVKPEGVLTSNLKSGNGKYTDKNRQDYGTAVETAKGKDLYHWNAKVDENGKKMEVDDLIYADKESELYNSGFDLDALEARLFADPDTGAINTDGENFERFRKTITDESDPSNVGAMTGNLIGKWVLKAEDGAQGGFNVKKEGTLHLDGYLYVEQLSRLATLEKHAKNPYSDTERVERVTKLEIKAEDTTAPLELKEVDPYTELAAVTPNTIEAEPEAWDDKPSAPSFSERELAPISINRVEYTEPEFDPDPDREDGDDGDDSDDDDDTTGGGTGADAPAEAPVSIADEAVPLVETPAPLAEAPVTAGIADEIVPLAETPEVEIAGEEVPLAETPLVEILDEDVPLADVPETGDAAGMWYALTILSACGLMTLRVVKKREEA